MSLTAALSVCLVTKGKSDFEVRERCGYTTREDGGTDYRKKSIPRSGTYGHKGSQLSHIGPDARSKAVQPIRGSKRTEGSGRGTTKKRLERYFGASPL